MHVLTCAGITSTKSEVPVVAKPTAAALLALTVLLQQTTTTFAATTSTGKSILLS